MDKQLSRRIRRPRPPWPTKSTPRSTRSPTHPETSPSQRPSRSYYDTGATTLNVVAGDGVAADGTNPVANGDDGDSRPRLGERVQRRASKPSSAARGRLPAHSPSTSLSGTTDETATLFTQSSEEDYTEQRLGYGCHRLLLDDPCQHVDVDRARREQEL